MAPSSTTQRSSASMRRIRRQAAEAAVMAVSITSMVVRRWVPDHSPKGGGCIPIGQGSAALPNGGH